jgi:hypothetical protein
MTTTIVMTAADEFDFPASLHVIFDSQTPEMRLLKRMTKRSKRMPRFGLLLPWPYNVKPG